MPSTGSVHQLSAAAGLATLSMMFVSVSGSASRSRSVVSYSSRPSYTYPSLPSTQESVTSCPSVSASVAVPVPMTAGMPSSRLTMAAWEVRPPWSVTMPAAFLRIGPQSGSVISVTRIPPSSKRSISSALWMICTGPSAIDWPMLSPVTSRSPFSWRWYVRSTLAARCDCTVSGRACTINSSSDNPSYAHSTSTGVHRPLRFV